MKTTLCAVLPLIVFANAAAKSSSDFDLLFLKNHIAAGFAIPVLIAGHGEHQGAGTLWLRQLPGFALKAEYAYNFNRHFGITTGSTAGLQVFGFAVHADADDFNMRHDLSRKYFQIMPFFSIPLLLSPRIFISGKSMLQADIGTGIAFIAPGSATATLSYHDAAYTKQIFEMRTRVEDSPQLILHVGLSCGVVVKGGNILKAGVAYDWGKRKTMRGSYTFLDDDIIAGKGTVFTAFSCFAFEFTWVFTRCASLQRH